MAEGTTIVPELFAAIAGLFSILVWLIKERMDRDAQTITMLQSKVWELTTMVNTVLPLTAESAKEAVSTVREIKRMMEMQEVRDEARDDAAAKRALPEKAGG